MRLNKYIAQSGICSRRKADQMIKDGEVKINGHIVTKLATQVNAEKDHVKVGSRLIKPESKFVYYMFNKPINVVSTMKDPLERPTVAEYFEEIEQRLFPVGRLDWDSEGLLILTNDGKFANSVMHPKEKIPKHYLAKIDGKITQDKIRKLLNGVTIPGGKVKALQCEKIKRGADKYDWMKISIAEGKNRQIRHMFAKVGFDVMKLQRVAIGQLRLGRLTKGEFKKLKVGELLKIFDKPKNAEKEEKPKRNSKPEKKLSAQSMRAKKKKKTRSSSTRGPQNKKQDKKKYFKEIRRKSR